LLLHSLTHSSHPENVGKTSLMNRLTGKSRQKSFFSKSSDSNISTDGVDLNQWLCDVGDVVECGAKAKSKQISFSVWDFAGQGMPWVGWVSG
jgi:GTPase SAR1 family protein